MVREYSAKKVAYCEKLVNLFETYDKVFIVKVDNVGSQQIQTIRKQLRGEATVLMGKNTLIRRTLRKSVKGPDDPVNKIIPYVYGNVGFIFIHKDMNKVREVIGKNKVPAAARAGTIAPNNVVVPAGPTGLEPGLTSFFQALNIATKITKGAIEILNDINLIKTGDKVGSSEVALLQKLNIKPFTYGLEIEAVYDSGSIYGQEVLNITNDTILEKFMKGVSQLTALSLGANFPSVLSAPHMVSNAFKKILAVALEIDYKMPQIDAIKQALANPGAAAAAAAPAAAPAGAAKQEAKAAPKVEEEEDEDVGLGGGGLFGGDDEW